MTEAQIIDLTINCLERDATRLQQRIEQEQRVLPGLRNAMLTQVCDDLRRDTEAAIAYWRGKLAAIETQENEG